VQYEQVRTRWVRTIERSWVGFRERRGELLVSLVTGCNALDHEPAPPHEPLEGPFLIHLSNRSPACMNFFQAHETPVTGHAPRSANNLLIYQ
jgi:hypothetical protein